MGKVLETMNDGLKMGERGRPRFRAGDVVRHDGDEYVLACDEERGEAWPAGWPCSPVKTNECELVKAASAEGRLRMLREAVQANEHSSYWPGVIARIQLEVAEPPAWQPKPVTHEWARGSFGLSVEARKRGGFVDVSALLLDGWTVSPWTPRAGFPATRPIEPSERGAL